MKPFVKNIYIRYKVGTKVIIQDPMQPELYGKWGVVRGTIPSDEPYMFYVEVEGDFSVLEKVKVKRKTFSVRSDNLWSKHEYQKCKEYYEHVRALADEAKKRKWDETIYLLLMVEVNRTYWHIADSQKGEQA
jgi:hypothetical protein